MLRQEAGFGCCFCGNPIGQYHHIVGYAEEQHDRPEDMMFVCLEHHDQITKGIIPEPEQRQAKNTPRNRAIGLSTGQLINRQDYLAVDIGAEVFLVGNALLITVDGIKAISFHRNGIGCVDVSVDIYNELDQMICAIDNNEWICDNTNLWDVRCDWHKLTVQDRKRHINFEIDTNSKPMTMRGQLFFGGIQFTFSDRNVSWKRADTSSSFSLQDLAFVGFDFDITSDYTKIVPKGGGVIVSRADRRQRLWEAAAALKRLPIIASP